MCQVRAFYRSIATLLVFILVCSAVLEARYSAKPHWSVLSSEQEIQMGKENADEISKSLPLVTDPALNKYVSDLGKSLAAHAPGTKYPYTFRIVNQKEINAFALPGGPVFINLGTIQALDREEQLAGVMAHEISHVVMRHSANMVSKQMMLQFGAEVLDGMLDKNGSMLAKMTQAGIGFGVNSVFLKFSRDMETEADKVGCAVMYDSGYNPQGMVDLFQKLEKVYGNSSVQFFLDHPNPGHRVEYIGNELRTFGPKSYLTDSHEFRNIKLLSAKMHPLTAAEIAVWQKNHPVPTGDGK